MQQTSVKRNGVQPALGYPYKYYATVMYANPDTNLLSVDGVSPIAENISDGSYPFVAALYAVTNGEPTGNTKIPIDKTVRRRTGAHRKDRVCPPLKWFMKKNVVNFFRPQRFFVSKN